MAKTQLDGDQQIQDYTMALKDLANNFLSAVDWNITDGAKDATIVGLSDGVDVSSPATVAQLNAQKDFLIALFGSGLQYMGVLDASNATAFEAAAHNKGEFYKIQVSGTLLTQAVNVGDMIIVNKAVSAGAMVLADIDIIDNTESADILRVINIQDTLLSQSAVLPLSANQGYILKGLIDQLDSKVKSRKYGDVLTTVQGSAICGPTLNTPITGTLRMFRNGSRMNEGSGNDFTFNYGTSVPTFEFNLKANDVILADYEY